MELTGEKWENYSTQSIDNNEKKKGSPYYSEETLKTWSVDELMKAILRMKENLILNHKSSTEVPVFIKTSRGDKYVLNSYTISSGSQGLQLILDMNMLDKLQYTAPDKRPEGEGEYWTSRGPSDIDCSGFVTSKVAGERLQLMVSYVLGLRDTKSHLDYRDYEPNWIQYKFSVEEFDLEKLDLMSRENNGILTVKILTECKL